MTPPRALIFDLDHTLADTTTVWQVAQDQLAAHRGHTWNDELEQLVHGLNAYDLAAAVHTHLHARTPEKDAQQFMRAALIAAYRSARSSEMPGACALVRRLHGRVPLAVASGSPLEGITTAIQQLGMAALFDVVMSSESVPRGKPHPDVFWAAAKALRVNSSACLVFEDSPAGVHAAHAAGMRSFVVPHGAHRSAYELATRCFTSWHEVRLEDVFGVNT